MGGKGKRRKGGEDRGGRKDLSLTDIQKY